MKTKYFKAIILMVALSLVFTFAGCDKQRNETESTTDQSVQSDSSSGEMATSEDTDDLSLDDAKAIALNHAGLSAADVVFVVAEFDNDVYIPHYDIEFTADGYEYDYEISAETGEIIEYDKEIDDNDKQADASDFIAEAEAKDIALQHSGLSGKDITGYKCELDTDDLIPHFEIEFKSGNYEYEYEINAETGKIMFSEKELDD